MKSTTKSRTIKPRKLKTGEVGIVHAAPHRRPIVIDFPLFLCSEVVTLGRFLGRIVHRIFLLDVATSAGRKVRQRHRNRRAVKAINRSRRVRLNPIEILPEPEAPRGRGRPSGSRDKFPRKKRA
ncbi:hypothetical protein [Hyphomicrobium sp.]|uniref:hypothetical protein n=1 Tax=Hyphomicrobium sp. TaxID=82 RepID=UPI001D3E4155|nr:hypothetical protein [Hyphomicrobium sp.]MBY0559882.1 hypothetical protein [Hyphomicrobium sp.]